MALNSSNVFIQIKPFGEHQENIVNQRIPFKSTQNETIRNKENFIDNKNYNIMKNDVNSTTFTHKNQLVITKTDAQTQVDTSGAVSSIDLTSCHPGENYYKRLAEQRRVALQQTLRENQNLCERIDSLEEELDTSRKELDEAVQLTEILKEFLADNEEQSEAEEESEAEK